MKITLKDSLAVPNGLFCGSTITKDHFRDGHIFFSYVKDKKGLKLIDVCGFSTEKYLYFFNPKNTKEIMINDDFFNFIEKIEPFNKDLIISFLGI